MLYLTLSLIILGCLAAVSGFLSHRKTGGNDVIVQGSGSCATCNGDDEHCMHDCLLEAAVKEIEYYDDEELDAFKGRSSADYTDEEVRRFADVLYTMRPNEVAGWNRSLMLRGVNMPDALKDEVMMMMESN